MEQVSFEQALINRVSVIEEFGTRLTRPWYHVTVDFAARLVEFWIEITSRGSQRGTSPLAKDKSSLY